MASKIPEEIEIVKRLLGSLGISDFSIVSHDRPDVLVALNDRRIGIEITTFHADENPAVGGSVLRAAGEKRASSNPGAVIVWPIPTDPYPGLQNRLTDKVSVARGYDGSKFDELWLLVAAQYPRDGAVAATFVIPNSVDVDALNRQFGNLLASSPFEKVYFHLLLNQVLFSWSRSSGWKVAGGLPRGSDCFPS